MYGEIELRVLLGRLLERLTQMEESAREARSLVEDAVRQIDANRTEPLPVAREMIVSVIEAAGDVGLERNEIIAAIDRDYGVEVSPNTVTTTLLRMQKAGLVSRRGRLWALR
jgi:hypothetical protein